MAKPKLEKDTVEIKKPNIEKLAELTAEFRSGKMIPKKYEMLKLRLAELWKSKAITDEEQALLKAMLIREMKRGNIQDKFKEIINRIEDAECVEQCRCKVNDAPIVFRLKQDQVCNFRREDQQNLKKAEAGSLYQYVIFVEEEIPPEFQMTKELLLKEERGHHADESMYPKTKTIMHRLQLDDAWFDKIFDTVEDLLSGSTEKEEAYTF